MSDQKFIYVVTHDGGCEGQSLPVIAFDNLDVAIGWCVGSPDLMVVTKVPMYPTLPIAPWYSLERIWPPK